MLLHPDLFHFNDQIVIKNFRSQYLYFEISSKEQSAPKSRNSSSELSRIPLSYFINFSEFSIELSVTYCKCNM